jgi:hypothetical protein
MTSWGRVVAPASVLTASVDVVVARIAPARQVALSRGEQRGLRRQLVGQRLYHEVCVRQLAPAAAGPLIEDREDAEPAGGERVGQC